MADQNLQDDAKKAYITKDNVVMKGAYRIPVPSVNEWIIFLPDPEKPTKKLLGQVTQVSKKQIVVVQEKGREKEETEEVHTITLDQLMLNLGAEANTVWQGMSVMGVSLKFFKKKRKTDMGMAYFFTDVEKKNFEMFTKALEYTKNVLHGYHMDSLWPIDFVFNKSGGKFWGVYHVNPEGLDMMEIKPKEWSPRKLRWLLLHEFCHGIHAYFMSKEEWAGWIKLYHKYVNVSEDTTKIKTILADFLNQGREYEPREDEEAVFDEAIGFISEKHLLELDNLYDLIDTGETDFIKSIWPRSADISEQLAAITEYGKESPAEFLCEAFAFYNLSDKSRAMLPNTVRTKMENDLSNIVKRLQAKNGKSKKSKK